MQIKFLLDSSDSITGEASIEIDKPIEDIYAYVGHDFFDNYTKWAVEVVEFKPESDKACIGAKAKQVRNDNGENVESIFEIVDFEPNNTLICQGITAPYRQSYLLENHKEKISTKLTFRFELLELEIFMRPFQKLIRYAIEDGAESTVENIKNLIDVKYSK
ncbi:MAG: hypothetical protein QG557_117 [Pseudomonadota bacterium]|jgi:hypothetical protein|nr:hypothetical protein [Pseudomonadota bacterium]